MFSSGDQDYDSAIGWDPRKTMAELRAEAKKKNPRAFADPPEMLYVLPVQEFVDCWAEVGQTKRLFGPFWLEKELAVLYSPPGTGKSALAVQIGESIARGRSVAPFDKTGTDLICGPQRVLYLDFELSRRQFSQRYTEIGDDGVTLENTYQFAPGFLRAESYWNGKIIEGYEDYTDMIFEDITRRSCAMRPPS